MDVVTRQPLSVCVSFVTEVFSFTTSPSCADSVSGKTCRPSLNENFGARERKKRGEVAKDRAPKFSFDEGLQVLPDTLAAQLGEAVKLNTPVTKLTQTDDGWRVTTSIGEADHEAVIFCGTAPRLAKLQIESGAPLTPSLSPSDGERVSDGRVTGIPLDITPFSEIRYPPVASVVLGFRREDVTHPCQGFGMLIP